MTALQLPTEYCLYVYHQCPSFETKTKTKEQQQQKHSVFPAFRYVTFN